MAAIVDEHNITCTVNAFYNEMPFNFSETAMTFADNLRRFNPVEKNYPNLHGIFKDCKDKRVADIGCGTGWFANCIAHHYGLSVVGVDLCESAIGRAIEVSKELGIQEKTVFTREDIFNLKYGDDFYCVNSLGVLHHTYNCREAFNKISLLVKKGGYIHIGLYHAYGRMPFLDLFKKYREKLFITGKLSEKEEEEAYGIFRKLNKNMHDETLLRSWFRDQVLHPHETQHTLQEVFEWLTDLNFRIISTSINKFNPVSDIQALFIEEKAYREISIEKNVKQNTYFPGFFTVLAKKEDKFHGQ